jgi:hypothetical protein
MPHPTLRGTIRYTSAKPERAGAERGREHFLWSDQPDGTRVVHAHCQIDDAPDVLRDVTLAVDATGRPLDGYVRISVGGRFEGSGFFLFGERAAECESFNRGAGRLPQRVRQRIELNERVRGLGAHPICGDALMLRVYDLAQGPGRAYYPNMMLTSPDHRGATGPALFALGFGLEYVGPERVTVEAGSFDALHFRYVDTAGQLPEEHPPYDVWCTADGQYLFLKGGVGGYMQTRYELVEVQR